MSWPAFLMPAINCSIGFDRISRAEAHNLFSHHQALFKDGGSSTSVSVQFVHTRCGPVRAERMRTPGTDGSPGVLLERSGRESYGVVANVGDGRRSAGSRCVIAARPVLRPGPHHTLLNLPLSANARAASAAGSACSGRANEHDDDHESDVVLSARSAHSQKVNVHLSTPSLASG
eukprot:1002484-Prymnesium_polylepis.1